MISDETRELAQFVLQRSAKKLGGNRALAKHLDCPLWILEDWLVGRHVPPVEVILKAVDPLLSDPAALWHDPVPPGVSAILPKSR